LAFLPRELPELGKQHSAQAAARMMQPRFDGTDRLPVDYCDLVQSQPVQVMGPDNVALRRGLFIDCSQNKQM